MTDTASMKLEGVEGLLKDLKALGPRAATRAGDTGTRKAAMLLRRRLRNSAPRQSGNLRKAIKYKYYKKSGKAYVGLRERYYYKTLEFGRKGGPPLRPFFEKAWKKSRREVTRVMIEETRKAVYFEAGKVYANSLRRRRR